jgi:hypothetical protein
MTAAPSRGSQSGSARLRLTAKSVGVFEICRVSEPWLMADRAGTHGPVSPDGICVTDTVFGVADAGAVPGAAQAAVLSVTMAANAATAPRVHRGVRDDISGALLSRRAEWGVPAVRKVRTPPSEVKFIT